MTNDLANRVIRTTVELRQLEFDIRAALEGLSQPAEAVAPVDPKVAAEFRDALDMTRHALWSYLAACSESTSEDSVRAVHGYRMTRVAQMLRMLRASKPAELAAITGSETFLEQVHAMATLTLDKHLKAKASAA